MGIYRSEAKIAIQIWRFVVKLKNNLITHKNFENLILLLISVYFIYISYSDINSCQFVYVINYLIHF